MAITVVGSANVDLVTFCDRFPVDGETLIAGRFEQHFGGKGANQVVMAARLGEPVAFIGAVGDDELGAATVADLKAAGVDIAGVSVTPGVPTGVASIWVDGHGANRILVAAGANATLAPYSVIQALRSGVPPRIVVAQFETPVEVTVTAFRHAASIGAVTVLNPAPAEPIGSELLALTDWLVPNETEFAALWGEPATPRSAALAAQAWGCAVVVTMGADGAIVVSGSTVMSVPATAVTPIDTTGAGDAFVGGFAHALSVGANPFDAVRMACACGSLSTQKPGARSSFPTREEVAQVIDL